MLAQTFARRAHQIGQPAAEQQKGQQQQNADMPEAEAEHAGFLHRTDQGSKKALPVIAAQTSLVKTGSDPRMPCFHTPYNSRGEVVTSQRRPEHPSATLPLPAP